MRDENRKGMSRKRDPESVTPEMMGGMMSALYPLRAGKNGVPRFRYDFVLSPGDAPGMCIAPVKDGKGIRQLLARYAEFSSRPYCKVLDEVLVRNTVLMIVDPIVYEAAGWTNFLFVAIHEYAHYLDKVIGSLYKFDLRASTFEKNLESLKDFHMRVSGKGSYKKRGPLFGNWCLCDGSRDPLAHDPLFYFILYFLERRAQEMGYFNRNAKPVYDEEP